MFLFSLKLHPSGLLDLGLIDELDSEDFYQCGWWVWCKSTWDNVCNVHTETFQSNCGHLDDPIDIGLLLRLFNVLIKRLMMWLIYEVLLLC